MTINNWCSCNQRSPKHIIKEPTTWKVFQRSLWSFNSSTSTLIGKEAGRWWGSWDVYPVWLPNNLISFPSIIIISVIGSLCELISISNSYVAHIKCWVCMNPLGQYFIYPPFHCVWARMGGVHVHTWLSRCVYVCVIRGQLMITLWLDLDQEHGGCITCIRLKFKVQRPHFPAVHYLRHKS